MLMRPTLIRPSYLVQRVRNAQSTPRHAKNQILPTLSERQLHFLFPSEILIVLISPRVMLDSQTRAIHAHATGHRQGGS